MTIFLYLTKDLTKSEKMPEWSMFIEFSLKLFFLFLNQNLCFGYSKEPFQWNGLEAVLLSTKTKVQTDG